MADRSGMVTEACVGDLEGGLLQAGYNVRFSYHTSDMSVIGSLLLTPSDCD